MMREAIKGLSMYLDFLIFNYPSRNAEYPKKAIWKNKDFDQPILVIGKLGEDENGTAFYAAKESRTGIPENELEFESL